MKRNVYILSLLLLLCLAGSTYAQIGFNLGAKAGYSWATVTDDSLSGQTSRRALSYGLALEFEFFGIAIEGDLLYSPRGATLENGDLLTLNYLSIPVVLKKKFLPALIHPYILAGLEWNYLLKAEEADVNIKEELKGQYFCGVVGGGVELSLLGLGAFIEGRYTHGFSDVWKGDERKLRNNVFTIYVGLFL